jgi:type II pantothenate kinase
MGATLVALLLLGAAAFSRGASANAAGWRRRRGDDADELLLGSSHMPPGEQVLTHTALLQLLRRVNVLDEAGACSLDIGGSLAKVAFFRRRDPSAPSCAELLGGCALPAAESLHVPALGGEIHFVVFETRYLEDCIDLVDRVWVQGLREPRKGERRRAADAPLPLASALAEMPSPPRRQLVMRATGGGSMKYQATFERIGVTLRPRDEMRSMVHGLNFLLTNVDGEAFSVDAGDPLSPLSPERAAALPRHPLPAQPAGGVFVPYLFVSFGSGVSLIQVDGWGERFARVGGSSIGGGTFWGLCRLLLRCGSFGELISLTERGVSSNVDMLVGDIYGGDCEAKELDKDVIAASFGKVIMCHQRGALRRAASQLGGALEGGAIRFALLLSKVPCAGALLRGLGLEQRARRRRARLANTRLEGDFRAEDIALSLLRLVSNNVGQLACLHAQKHGLSRIFFGGSFIRSHPYTVATISNAVKFFSKGKVEALFLKREGFVGAIGALLDTDDGPLGQARAADGTSAVSTSSSAPRDIRPDSSSSSSSTSIS